MVDDAKIDSTSLIYHPGRVSQWLEKGDCPPINVELAITNVCNHRCIFCGLDWVPRTGEFLNKDLLAKTFIDMSDYGVRSVTLSAESEPTVHPNFPEIVRSAKESGLDTAVATNGERLSPDMAKQVLPSLTWIRYSIDAFTGETYSKIHGVDKRRFETVLANLAGAVEVKRQMNLPVTIGTQIVVVPENLNEVEPLAKLMQDMGVDNLQVKPFSPHPYSHLPDQSVDLSKTDLEQRLERYPGVVYRSQAVAHNAPKKYARCHSLSFYCLVDARGNVMPCNMFYDRQEFIYGNIKESNGSFRSIWESERRRRILTKIGSMNLETCRNACVPAAKNEFLDRLKNPHPHDNFV